MALSAEIQVKKDLGVPTRKKKATNFSKLFEMPPHITYVARDPKTVKRLRRLMNTNVVSLTDWDFMERLEERTVEVHVEDLQERMDGRARAAAAAAHLRLWEEVLRGQCTLPLEHLADPCMRDIRRQQLKLEALQHKADKLGTTFQRVLSQPKEWSPPTNWERLKKLEQARASVRASSAERYSLFTGEVRKTVETADQNTICSLGDYFNRLSDNVQDGGAAPLPQQRRRRAKSVEGESEYRGSGQSSLPTAMFSLRPSQAPHVPSQALPPAQPRSARRVMPEKRKPVVYPAEPPRCLLLSAEGGKHVLGPPANPDYIIPKYFVPKALDHLRQCKTLDDLFTVGDELFDIRYPDDDNRRWNDVSQHLKEAREERLKQ